MKFAAAAATNSGIILSRDMSNIDILEDYPLYVGDDISDIQNKYELAQSWFGTNKWNELLDQMKFVKEKTNLENLVHLYLQFFNELEETNL
jgi:DNA topoisomerase VI subunit A